jgi:hypothetical protein
VLDVVAALRDAAPERAVRRARWWPRSVLQRVPADAESLDLVDHVG